MQRPQEDKLKEQPGALAKHAKQLLGSLLYPTRCVRPDVSFAVGELCRHVSRWSRVQDNKMHRLIGYLKSTVRLNLKWWVRTHDASPRLELSLFCDANFGGTVTDADFGPSTSGWNLVARDDSGSWAMLDWGFRRQRTVSRSTPEAELVALMDSLTVSGIPLLCVTDSLQFKTKLMVLSDSTSAQAATEHPLTSALRTMTRTHDISLAWLAQQLERGTFDITYVSSEDNIGDVGTKGLPVEAHTHLCGLMGLQTRPLRNGGV